MKPADQGSRPQRWPGGWDVPAAGAKAVDETGNIPAAGGYNGDIMLPGDGCPVNNSMAGGYPGNPDMPRQVRCKASVKNK